MTLKELRKEKEKLNKKREELCEISDKEMKTAVRYQDNQLGAALIMRLVFSMLPYVGMVIVVLLIRSILGALGIPNIFLYVPKALVLPLFLAPSLAFGTYTDNKISKNKRNNEIFKLKEDEKLEKEIRHQIESSKAWNRDEVFKETISKIEEKEKFVELNGEFYASNPCVSNFTEREEKIDKLLDSYNKNLKTLDIISTQSVLLENFKEERLKGYDKQKLFTSSMGYGLLTTIYTLMPFYALGLTFNGVPGLLTIFGIFGASAVVFGGYCNYRTKQKIRIFKKLNEELGEHALTETSEHVISDEHEIKRKKERLIEETANVLGLLQEERSLLEQVKEENSKLTDSYENTNKFENTYNIENFESHFEMDVKDGNESIVEGPTLVKKK